MVWGGMDGEDMAACQIYYMPDVRMFNLILLYIQCERRGNQIDSASRGLQGTITFIFWNMYITFLPILCTK